MAFDDICQNCSQFISDSEDLVAGLGICIMDNVFEQYIDAILENADFSDCYDIYIEKRYNGEKEACTHFEELDIIEISNDDEVYGVFLHEQMKHQNVDELIKMLYCNDNELKKRAIREVASYIALGNTGAYEGLVNYYMGLAQVEDLEDVHIRVEIVDAISFKNTEKATIDAYVNELVRTPSNNTTKQLYSEILKYLGKCSTEMVRDPLLELLVKRQYSYKMRNKILEIANDYRFSNERDSYFEFLNRS